MVSDGNSSTTQTRGLESEPRGFTRPSLFAVSEPIAPKPVVWYHLAALASEDAAPESSSDGESLFTIVALFAAFDATSVN